MKKFVFLVVGLFIFKGVVLGLIPDTTLYLEFPQLPKTSYYQAIGKHSTPLCSIYLPRNFDESRKFPVILWIDGGMGGAGDCVKYVKDKVGDINYILINFPLFKNQIESLKPDSSNLWSRLRVRNTDSDIIWTAYKIMLDSIFQLIPQIDCNNAFMGGFSNGAHATAVLLNRPQAEITHYFNKFFFIEGGDGLENYSILKNRPVLYIQGTELSFQNWVLSFYKKAKAKKANAKFVFMPRVGHNFPPMYFKFLRKWLLLNTSSTME